MMPVMTGVADTYIVRLAYPLGMIPGLLPFAFMLFTGNKSSRHMKISGTLIILSMILALGMEYITFERTILERYRCNQADQYLSEIIGRQITLYEEETGNQIQKLAFYTDNTVVWKENGYNDTEIHLRAFSCGWSRLYAMNFYLDKDYVEVEADPQLQTMFSQKNWDSYDEEQLIFDGDTLHICVY